MKQKLTRALIDEIRKEMPVLSQNEEEARQSNGPELFPEEHRQTCWRDTVPNLFQTG